MDNGAGGSAVIGKNGTADYSIVLTSNASSVVSLDTSLLDDDTEAKLQPAGNDGSGNSAFILATAFPPPPNNTDTFFLGYVAGVLTAIPTTDCPS